MKRGWPFTISIRSWFNNASEPAEATCGRSAAVIRMQDNNRKDLDCVRPLAFSNGARRSKAPEGWRTPRRSRVVSHPSVDCKQQFAATAVRRLPIIWLFKFLMVLAAGYFGGGYCFGFGVSVR